MITAKPACMAAVAPWPCICLKERPPIRFAFYPSEWRREGLFDRDTGVAKESDCSNVDALPALTATYRPVNNCGEPLQWWQKILGQ